MSFLDWAPRLIPHIDQADDMFEAGVEFVQAPDSLGKWAATKKGGDIAVPIFHDVTGLSFESEEQLCQYIETLKLGDGRFANFIDRLKKFSESPLGQLLLEMMLKKMLPV